jgi:hypothetical protein
MGLLIPGSKGIAFTHMGCVVVLAPCTMLECDDLHVLPRMQWPSQLPRKRKL